MIMASLRCASLRNLPATHHSSPCVCLSVCAGVLLEVVDRLTLVEWLANNYKSFGATLEFITDRSQEGSQFCKGFGGIGGLLRWKVDFVEMEMAAELDNEMSNATNGGDDYDDSFI